MKQQNYVLYNQLRADYEAIKQQGSPLLACQGMFVPDGMENMRFLIKSGIRPIVSNGDPAEVQYAGGYTGIVAGIPNTKFSGSVQIIETEAGHVQNFAEWVVANGGMFDATYYDGRIDSFTRAYRLENVALRFEPSEFDTESRSQVTVITGQIDYNYFGLYADIGANGTVTAGQRNLAGAEAMVSSVKRTIDTATQAVESLGGLGRAVRGLFSR